MAENDETSDKNLSSSENTKTSQQIEESQNMSNDLKKLEGKIYRYNREEMLEIRENKFSRTRPKELSKEFDNEDGFFSPDKWLQHQWQCEGVENRGGKRSKATTVSGVSALPIGLGTSKVLGAIFEAASNNNNGLDQQMILSPQRRGFSSGCRASSPSRNNDEEKTSSSKSRWRQGQLSNGVDFKPAFQKSALEANSRSSRSSSSQNNTTNIAGGGNSNSWTTMFGSAKHNWEKDKNRRGGEQRERNRYSTNTDSEPIPEWMNDGPTSHLDVIELKGFDDDSGGAGANTGNEKNQKRRRSKGKEPSIGPKSSNKSRGRRGSREKSKGRAGSSPRSSTRPKRHSSGDISTNKNNCSNSRPASRNTPSQSNCAERKNSFPAATKFIQASELESFIIMEQQEKLNQEKMKDGNGNMFDLFSTLGIEPPKQKQNIAKECEEKQNKIPNSDAEFAAYILDVPANQIAKPISGTNPEPTSSRFSRFFAKDPDDKKTGKSIKDDKLLTKSQLDISSIATHYQGHAAAGRQSSSPPNNMLGSSGHLRPASAELQRSSPLVLRQQSPNLMKIVGIHPQMQNKFPGMPFGPNMSPAEFNVAAEREAVFQQMQAANFSTGNLASQHFSPSPIQFQQQQFLNQLRKRASPIMPMSTLFPGAARPSSVEHPHQMLSSPMFPHQQRQSPLPQMHMPPYASSSSNGSGHLPIHFQHLMIETARRMQPNPNIAPGPEHIRAAYFELLSKDPKMRHYIQMNPNAHNQFELPIGFGNGSFPIGNPPPFHSPHLFTGSVGPPAPPFNHGPGGMHGQFGFPPPTGPFPSHMQHPFGGQPSFFQQHQQFSNMNPPPPFPPPNVHQQGPKPTNTLLNTTAFMPTSVMRQMSKMPGGSSNGGNGDSFDLGSSSNTSSTMFLQKLFGETNSAKAGRAILGRDPDEGLPRNVPRISGCMKLEDIEQRELAALQQQQSSSHNPILASPLGLANENANFL